MRELAFTEGENGFEVSLQGCAFGMFFNSLQNLFIHIGLIGFSLLRRFIFFFLGCKNIASFSFLALEKRIKTREINIFLWNIRKIREIKMSTQRTKNSIYKMALKICILFWSFKFQFPKNLCILINSWF